MTSISDDVEGLTTRPWEVEVFDQLDSFMASHSKDAVNPARATPPDLTSQHDYKTPEPLLETYAQAMTSSDKPSSQPVTCSAYPPADPSRAFKDVGTAPQRKVLHKGSNRVARKKRHRSPDWSAEEKHAYLKLKVEALSKVKGKDWGFISQGLEERHGFIRSPKRCEQLWGTLRKAHRAIVEHESLKDEHPPRRNWVSYFQMDEDEKTRINKQLPRVFPLEWNKMMEMILAEQANRSRKKCKESTRAQDQSIQEQESDQSCYTLVADPLGGGTKGSKGNTEELRIRHLVEGVVDSALQRLGCRKNSRATGVEDSLIVLVSTLVKRQVEEAANSALQSLGRTGEDDVLASAAPLLLCWMKDALNASLQPVSSTLEAAEKQGEQEHQARLRVNEERSHALDLEEMQIKRKRVRRHRRVGRVSAS